MSYCRWHNTLRELRDCFDHIGDEEELSAYELLARNQVMELCKRIVEWSPDDPVEEKTEVLIGSSVGRYIPQKFANDFYILNMRWVGADPEDITIIRKGPDTEDYDDAWANVLNDARYLDKDGREWKLWQDCDLFVYTGNGDQFT